MAFIGFNISVCAELVPYIMFNFEIHELLSTESRNLITDLGENPSPQFIHVIYKPNEINLLLNNEFRNLTIFYYFIWKIKNI